MDSHSHNPSEMPASDMAVRRMQLALELITQDPKGFDTILEDRVEQEPVLDYITDLEIRRDIFVEIQALAREVDPSSPLTGISLGIAMVAPINQLRWLLDKAKSDEDVHILYGVLYVLRGGLAIHGMRAFVTRGDRQPSLPLSPRKRGASETLPPRQTPPKSRKRPLPDPNLPAPPESFSTPGISTPSMPSPDSPATFFPEIPLEMTGNEVTTPATPKTKRKAEAANAAKERDSWTCVLSGMEDLEAAHIFPFPTTEKGSFYYLKHMLQDFWGVGKADKWAKLFESTDTTESARNLICLNRQLHWWFNTAKMALKPLRVTEEGAVVVQFHWLKGSNLKPQTPLENPFELLELADILTKAGLADNQAWGDRTAHRASGRLLQTGQTFVLGAKNPDEAPSFELLQLSWDLLRLAAISGAALPGSLVDEGNDGGDCFEDDEDWGEYGRSEYEEDESDIDGR